LLKGTAADECFPFLLFSYICTMILGHFLSLKSLFGKKKGVFWQVLHLLCISNDFFHCWTKENDFLLIT